MKTLSLIFFLMAGVAFAADTDTNTNVPTQASQAAMSERASESAKNQTMIVAVIVALGTIIAPLLTMLITNSNARKARMEDYARQDIVADRVEAASKRTADRAETAAKLLLDFNVKSEEVSNEIKGQLEVIHTLTNSAMTSAIQREADALTAQCVLMEEVIELKIKMGHEPNKATIGALENLKLKIKDAQKNLSDRAKQAELVSAQLKAQEATADRIKTEKEISKAETSKAAIADRYVAIEALKDQIDEVPEKTATKVVEHIEQKEKL